MTHCSRYFRPLFLGLLVALAAVADAAAAEIKIMTPRSMWTVLKEIGPEFERSSGYQIRVDTDIAATLADRIIGGERFDIFVGPPVQVERLIKTSKVVAGTRTPIARSGIGVEVRAGAPKPDISTVEAFKRALMNAKSIGYLLQEGSSGEAIRHKVVRPDKDIVSEMVAKGEIELGMVVITQIMTTPGVELVGPIPAEVQSYIRWSGVVSANSAAPGVARDLIRFLTGPKALPVFKAQGMEAE
jgi:molybdate transport system substrate-binding protein